MDTESKSQSAAGIGDSGNASGAAKSAMAGHSQPLRKSGKPSTWKTLNAVTPNEAAQILLSALSYCKKAGLSVIGYNEGSSLRLSIDGIHYDFDRHAMITLDGDTKSHQQVTP